MKKLLKIWIFSTYSADRTWFWRNLRKNKIRVSLRYTLGSSLLKSEIRILTEFFLVPSWYGISYIGSSSIIFWCWYPHSSSSESFYELLSCFVSSRGSAEEIPRWLGFWARSCLVPPPWGLHLPSSSSSTFDFWPCVSMMLCKFLLNLFLEVLATFSELDNIFLHLLSQWLRFLRRINFDIRVSSLFVNIDSRLKLLNRRQWWRLPIFGRLSFRNSPSFLLA